MIKSQDGFTLLETLVALAIVAVGLAAGLKAVAMSTESAWRIRGQTYAIWTAQNALAESRAQGGGFRQDNGVVMGGVELYQSHNGDEGGVMVIEVRSVDENGPYLASLRGSGQP